MSSVIRVENYASVVSYERPAVLTEDNVIFWCDHAEELSGDVRSKALLFLKHDCLKYIGDMPVFGDKYVFLCLPLNKEDAVIAGGRTFNKKPFSSDYNSTTYRIRKGFDNKTFVCSCQGWHSKNRKGEIEPERAGCCHVLALYLAFKLKKFGGSEI